MAAQFERIFTQDLQERLKINYCPDIVFTNDNLSNVFHVALYNGGEAYSGGGSVSATCILSDGSTVPITNGAIAGNVVTVSLIQACLAVPGQIQVFVKLTSGSVITTVFAGIFSAVRTETGTIVDPGTVIQSVNTLINRINTAIDSIPADYTQVLNAIAGTYSASKTYAVGDYVWYPGTSEDPGALYRCTTAITTAESWNAAHWTNATFGDDLASLKSAFETVSAISNVTSGRNLISYINTGKWSSGSTPHDFIAYSPDKIVLNGTASANVAAFITDTFTLPVGDYTLTAEGVPDNVDVFLRLTSPNASTTYGDSRVTPQFTLTAETEVRLLIWVKAGTYNNLVVYPCFGNLKPYSNATLTKVVEDLNSEIDVLEAEDETIISVMNKFPFDQSARIFSSIFADRPYIGRIAKAFKNVQIFGANENYTYYLGNTILNDTVNNNPFTNVQIRAKSNTSDTDVSAFIFQNTNTQYSGIQTFELTAQSPLGGYAIVTIDFSEIVNGDKQNFDIGTSKLSIVCNKDYLLAKDITYLTNYPFINGRPSLNATQQKVYDVVKDIKIYGADYGDELFIRQFGYKWTALDPARNYITIYKGTTKVCEYNNIITPTGIATVHCEEFSNSGITADITIDFSQLTDNFVMTGTLSYDILGISKLCFVADTETPVILIPDTVYAVVGIETNIYWDSAIKCGNLSDYNILVTGKGEALNNRWHYIPATAESFSLRIDVRDKSMRLRATKTIQVISKQKNSSSAVTIKAIHLGDSMIDNEYHVPELKADFAETNITYQTYGTRNGNTNEGRGGWTSGMYLRASTDPNVPNPFYNPTTDTFDFSYYMQNQGYPVPDYVFIFLGTNDIKGISQPTGVPDGINVSIKNFRTIVNSIKNYNSSIKVCICTPAIGASEQYPYGIMYGDNRIKQSLHKYGIQFLVDELIYEFGGRENEGIYIVYTGNSLDTVNGMRTTTVNASARITKEITVQNDPYHPTAEGYYQFADSEFVFVRNQLS